MDLLAACRVFVAVGERGSFTVGAAAARVPQSVASRRVAALERHFGALLFDRSSRNPVLTAFGRDLLPAARRLVEFADALEHDAEQAKLRPLSVAVPETCTVRTLATAIGAARELGIVLDFRAAAPVRRVEMLRSRQVRAALVAVPPDEAEWRVRLGVAGPSKQGAGALRIETLRPDRKRESVRRIWIQPEDDMPHVRDLLVQQGHRAALMPAQIVVSASLAAAVSDTLRTADLLLCPAAQARELGLHWRPLAGTPVTRGYEVAAVQGDDARRLRESLWDEIARCLGVPAEAQERR